MSGPSGPREVHEVVEKSIVSRVGDEQGLEGADDRADVALRHPPVLDQDQTEMILPAPDSLIGE